jgi:drug/metabolite transporter (DMT)-like permease
VLTTVHLLFIVLSALLALFGAVWAFDAFQRGEGAVYGIAAALALAAAVALATYGIRFRRRSRYW